MPLVTDVPHAVASLRDPAAAWRDVGDGLDTDLRARWDELGGAGGAWTTSTLGARPVCVVERAPASQFDRLLAWLTDGVPVPDGLACVALEGARFHGQRGRPWRALRGNLHLSVHLALDVAAEAAQAGLAALPAVATARAIERVTDGRVAPRLKWVNDVLVEGRKLAGVLVATQLHGGRVRDAVVGIGVNVRHAPDLPVAARVVPPTALVDHDPAFAARHGDDGWAALLGPLLEELDHGRDLLRRGEGAALVAAYRARAAFLGRSVTVWPVDDDAAAPLARGRVRELRDDLSLVLEGHPAPVHHGRMTIDPDA